MSGGCLVPDGVHTAGAALTWRRCPSRCHLGWLIAAEVHIMLSSCLTSKPPLNSSYQVYLCSGGCLHDTEGFPMPGTDSLPAMPCVHNCNVSLPQRRAAAAAACCQSPVAGESHLIDGLQVGRSGLGELPSHAANLDHGDAAAEHHDH